MALAGVSGHCNDIRTLQNISLSITPNRLFNVVKPSNTNGASLFHVLAALLLTSKNSTSIYNLSIIGSCGTVHEQIKCVPKHFSLCPSLAIRRGLGFFTAIFRAAVRRGCSLIHSVCQRVRPFHGHHTKTLSNNVGRGLTLDYTLVRGPSILFLSRPAANISPISHGRF